MKKFALILELLLVFSANAKAELYHGIDIDEVYKNSDWSNKENIKELIDDYTLLLQYQEELDNCYTEAPDILDCYDVVADKIITNLYVQSDYNIINYKELKKALSNAYGLKNCRNKYDWPSGNMCEINTMANMTGILKIYIQNLIDSSKEKMYSYSSILNEYKREVK